MLNNFSNWRREEVEKLVKLNGDLGLVNSINITMLSAGKQHNIIPETAEAIIDIRINPNINLKDIESRIDEFTNVSGVSWEYFLKHDSTAISTIDPKDLYWRSIPSAFAER